MEITKACPVCGRRLVVRENRDNGTLFIGCPSWPDCIYTEKYPEYLKLIKQGATQLPGFEKGAER